MKKSFFKKAVVTSVIAAFTLAIVPAVQAQTLDPWGGGDEGITEGTIKDATGLGDKDPREIASNVINIILGFLGIIAVVLILAGGFMWMTAVGNEDKVAQAKGVMISGVIGLIIVLAAFGIARFVVNALVDATTV